MSFFSISGVLFIVSFFGSPLHCFTCVWQFTFVCIVLSCTFAVGRVCESERWTYKRGMCGQTNRRLGPLCPYFGLLGDCSDPGLAFGFTCAFVMCFGRLSQLPPRRSQAVRQRSCKFSRVYIVFYMIFTSAKKTPTPTHSPTHTHTHVVFVHFSCMLLAFLIISWTVWLQFYIFQVSRTTWPRTYIVYMSRPQWSPACIQFPPSHSFPFILPPPPPPVLLTPKWNRSRTH